MHYKLDWPSVSLQPVFQIFWHPLLRVFDTERGVWGSIVELRAYITLKVLLVIEWRHELIANDWRSMARNLTVVCFSVMFTIQWLMPQHWHTSPQGQKTGSGNTFADSGFSCLLNFQLHDKSLIMLVKQDSPSAIQTPNKIPQHVTWHCHFYHLAATRNRW